MNLKFKLPECERARKVKPKTAKTAKRLSPIDSAWVRKQMLHLGVTLREVARQTSLDPAVLHRLFAGRRRLKLEEAHSLGLALQIPTQEILERFGLKLEEDLGAPGSVSRKIRIHGWLDGRLVLHPTETGLRGSKEASLPSPDKNVRVVRCQTAGSDFSEFAGLDGTLVYYRPSKHFDPESVGRPVLVEMSGSDPTLRLRVVRRGYGGAGRFDLCALSGKVMEEDVGITSTSPVLWMKY